MIWKAKYNHEPKHGEGREVNHFSWLPKRIGDSYVWMSYWQQLQIYTVKSYVYVDAEENKEYPIKSGKWITVLTRIA